MGADSVWFGDGHQGNLAHDCRETNGIAGLPPEVVGPRGRYLTGLVESCGALPRKCLFVCLFVCLRTVQERIASSCVDGISNPLRTRF
jgi:hypothetical protein